MRDLTKPCSEWTGYKDKRGYGRVSTDGRKGRLAHKVAWERLFGPVPEGLELDHLCMNPSCVEPSHLEPVTHQENMRRAGAAGVMGPRLRSHCPHGHEYTPENIYTTVDKRGYAHHHCRECSRIRVRARRAARKA